MKKVALIHYAYPPVIGGVEVLMKEHAEVLTQMGYQVTVLAGSGKTHSSNIKVIELPELQSLKNFDAELQNALDNNEIPAAYHELVNKIESLLNEYLQEMEVVIVHNMITVKRNLPFIEAFTRFSQKNPSKKIIAYTHDHNYILEEKLNYPEKVIDLEKKLLTTPIPHATYVTISQTFAKLLTQVIGVPLDKIITIPNGINTFRFLEIDPIIREFITTYDLMNKFPIILSPVNIVERKNLEYAVEILGELKKRYPNLCYIITGQTSKHKDTSSYFDKIKDLIKQKQLDKNTLYFSYIYNRYLHDKEIHDLYTISDAVFYFSKSENFGLPLLEASLSRTPIFSSNLDVFTEVQGDSPFAFDYEKQSPQEVAETVISFLENDIVTKQNYKIRTTYDLKSIVEKHLLPLF